MSRARLLAVLSLLPLIAACGAGGEELTTSIRTVTPQNVAIPNATPTSTPIPPPELILSATQAPQAGAILASLVGDAAGGTVSFLGRTYPLSQGDQSIYTFIGVAPEDPPGVHPLRVEFRLTNGSTGTLTEQVEVLPTQWTVDAITISEEQANLLDPRIAADENALLASVYGEVTPEKLWQNGWLVPAAGAITTRFGEQRSYNGGDPAGHHTGTDIGAEAGTPVVATNSGRVVLARQLQLRGNMVVIDHGGGLFSGYAHLSAFAVAEGQEVARGDLIGYVGNTGLSTGAHLHWEMAIHGVLVDALRFTDGSNGF